MISPGDQQEKSNMFRVFKGINTGKKVVYSFIDQKD